MTRTAVALVLAAAVFNGAPLPAQDPAGAAIVYPPARATMRSPRVMLFYQPGQLNERARLELRRDGRTISQVGTVGVAVHQVVTLNPGANHIELAIEDSVVMRWDLGFAPPWPAGQLDVPAAPTFRLHASDAASVCSVCHAGVWQPAAGASLEVGQLECFTCHRGLARAPFAHRPAADWQCFSCHRSAGDWALHDVLQPVGPLCLSCHGALVAHFVTSRVGHGPAASGYCTVCHDPHGGQAPNTLREPQSAMCGACHPDHTDGTHITGWTGGRPHPVSGVRDPLHPGRELGCSSCHDPHAENGRFLFRGADAREDLCRNCHAESRGP